MRINLYDYQLDALHKMHNGCILCGGVGSGKSRTSLAYYFKCMGGELGCEIGIPYSPMVNPKDLYIITTARKRNTLEWESELAPFGIVCPGADGDIPKQYAYPGLKITIDSWNNIKKYEKVYDAFFIFDEQRVVGSGAWAKTFIKLSRKNQWILLSATPGDTWSDYISVFIANGFYKNKTEFSNRHCVYNRFSKYPKVDKYIDQGVLIRHRNEILVNMDFVRKTNSHHEDIFCDYDIELYKQVGKTRWNPYSEKPMQNASELCYVWRRVVNSDTSRLASVEELLGDHERAIIFYNFDYELKALMKLCEHLVNICDGEFSFAQYNGHAHQALPTTPRWAYLVQYTAGCEGWNCIETDTTIFYSQNYSYKVMEQASGRINRLNTPYSDLYYYHLKSRSGIDMAIAKALRQKKQFNENKYVSW